MLLIWHFDNSFQEYFEDLVKFMSSGPSHILVLTKGETGEGIVEEWRNLLGPASVEEAKEQAPDRYIQDWLERDLKFIWMRWVDKWPFWGKLIN